MKPAINMSGLVQGLLLSTVILFSACTSMREGDLELEGGSTVDAWSDDEILHTFITLNEGEVMTSQPVANAADISAQMQSTPATDAADMSTGAAPSGSLDAARAEVREFARRMIEHHGQTMQRAQRMASDTELDANANLVSTTLRNTAEGVTARLRPLSGPEMEQQYIQSQIVLHQNTLHMLDHTLIPGADDANLRQMLQEARQSVASHLAWAQQIHGSLQAGMNEQTRVSSAMPREHTPHGDVGPMQHESP